MLAFDQERSKAPKHTADEEESLFPRMRKMDSVAASDALEKIKTLEADHETANHGHELVERLGQKWLKENSLLANDVALLSETLATLQQTYSRHINIEDNEIFPLASKILNDQQLANAGREMSARRGQGFKTYPEMNPIKRGSF